MEQVNYRNNRTQIRTLLLAAAPIYSLFGFFLLYGFKGEKTDYLKYILISCMHLTFAGILSIKRFKNNSLLPSILAIIMNTLATGNVFFQPQEYCNSPAYFLSIVIIATAVLDISIILSKKIAYLNILMVLSLFIGQAIRAESLHNISILGPLAAFLIWQTIMVLKLIGVFEQVISARQFSAYKSTVVMLNHEFNNVNTVCLMLLENMKAQNSPTEYRQKDLEHLSKNIIRLTELIQKVTQLQKFQEESYTAEGPLMVKLE